MNSADLAYMIPEFGARISKRAPHVLVFGDLILDQYLSGHVENISREAPIPVLECRSKTNRPGGAANVAANLAALGANVTLVGAVGDDEAADILAGLLRSDKRLDPRLLTVPGRETTHKIRVGEIRQQIVRVDFGDRVLLSPAENEKLFSNCFDEDQQYDAIIVSDYDRGVCTEAGVQKLIKQARRAGTPILCDPRGDNFEKYSGADLIAPNRKEAAGVVKGAFLKISEAGAAADELRQRFRLKACLITLGEDGMALAQPRPHGLYRVKAVSQEVADVTGAGDTVMAVLAMAKACGFVWTEAVELANAAAGLVVRKSGSATVCVNELQDFYSRSRSSIEAKIVDKSSLQTIVKQLREDGAAIVFTNGCFDLLHAGHIDLLSRAADLGDIMILGLNSDRSVERLKGPSRPVIGEKDRAHLLAALGFVDYVVLFDEDTPLSLIEFLRPDVLVKGADYRLEDIVGADLVKRSGGQVMTLPLKPGVSTSSTIDKISSAKS